MNKPMISKREIYDRYNGGTMGYDQCISALMLYHKMTEGDADNLLFSAMRPKG